MAESVNANRHLKRELFAIGNVITRHASRTYEIEQQQHGATHWNRVENKVGRMGECNKNKRKTREERWHVTAYDGRRSGGVSIDQHFVSVTKKTIHVVIVHFVNIYGKIMWLFVLTNLNKIYSDRDMVDLR